MGVQRGKRTPNVLICWNLGKISKNPIKITDNPGKNGAQRCLTLKNGAQRLQKNTWILFWRSHQKRVLYGRKFVGKSHTKLFGHVWGTSGKNPSHAQKFACSYSHAQGLAKNIFAGGPKVAKFHFHHSKLRKQLFLQNIWCENVKFQNPGGRCPPLPRPCPKTLYNRKAEENNKIIFTNKRIMNFENNSHWYLLFF